LSRFMDLLEQIPPGKEEIPDILLKKLDIAATNLVTNQAGLCDIPEGAVKDDYVYEGIDTRNDGDFNPVRGDFEYPEEPEVNDRGQICGLPSFYYRFPIRAGDLWLCEYKEGFWELHTSFNEGYSVPLCNGSKKQMIEEGDRLINIRDKDGEEAYQEEIMKLRHEYMAEEPDEYGHYY